MSFLFGKKKQEQKIDINATILVLKDAITSLNKRRDFLDNNMNKEKEMAREWLKKGNKQKALLHMKKLKLYEKESNVIDGNIYNLETQRLTIESFSTTKNIVEVMKKTSQVLKQGPNPDEVSDLVDEINDSIESHYEISEELSRPIGQVLDEDELLRELDDIEEKEMGREMDNFVKRDVILTNLPKVPIKNVKDVKDVKEDKEDKNDIKDVKDVKEDEIRELELLMS